MWIGGTSESSPEYHPQTNPDFSNVTIQIEAFDPVRPEYNKSNILTTLRPLMAFAILASGLGQIAPAVAEGTAAGADISNTATASYEDPNDPGKPIDTVSNTVKVVVSKVAGINILKNGTEDLGPNPGGTGNVAGNYAPGDVVAFDYKLVNVGNASVQFSIPGAATVSSNADFQKVQYKDGSQWVDVTSGSSVTIPGFVPVDGFKEVRVLVKIKSTATTNQSVDVTLGKTSTTDTQNAQRGSAPEVSDAADVFTVDITNDPIVAGSVPQGPAVNGVREASRIQSIGVNQDTQTFANITMTGSAAVPDPNSPGDLTKNKITYDITVKVDPTAPTGSNKTPADLAPTTVKISDGTTITSEQHVLISDPVPTGTTPTKVTAPNDWKAVYSTTVLTTGQTIADVVWLPVPTGGVPPTGTTVTFVGFIKTDTTPLPINANPYTGFQVEVQTTGIDTVNGGSVNNVAYVYGNTTKSDGTTDPTKPVVDQTGTPALNTPTGGIPVVTPIAPPGSIFNGPFQKPQAVGPDNTTATDYSNKSVQITAADLVGVDPVTGNLPKLGRPVDASFNNTIENKGTAADVYLLPSAPTVVTDLPNGSLVRISYGSEAVTYTYDGNGNYTPIAADTGKMPVKVPVGAGSSETYGVQVTLPGSDTNKVVEQLKGYPAPITAFTGVVPTAGQTTVPAAGTTGLKTNVTIDRVYTGYLKLTKESRVLNLNANGVTKDPVAGADGTFSKTNKSAAPGQYIEYQIKYENLSSSGGSNNINLEAGKLKIKEDGLTGGNTWGNTTTHDQNSASDTKGGTINYSPAGTNNTNTTVTGYEVDMGTTIKIAPGDNGTFKFIRKVK
jgi:hypothetical protein